ncbi:hypothetical protein KI387_034712, partial [Taxus chinensis]
APSSEEFLEQDDIIHDILTVLVEMEHEQGAFAKCKDPSFAAFLEFVAGLKDCNDVGSTEFETNSEESGEVFFVEFACKFENGDVFFKRNATMAVELAFYLVVAELNVGTATHNGAT